jgi:CelD/BcsL family acetyltransferase involved in cellulose biosynthesis
MMMRDARAAVAAGYLTLDRLESLDHDGSEWAALAFHCRNVFGTPEFLSSWWRWFGRDGTLRTYAVRDGDRRLLGLLPLYEWRGRPLRVLRFIGHGAGDQLGPLAQPAARDAVGQALLRILEDDFAVLVGEQLPCDERWTERLDGRRIGSEGNPILRFDQETWEEYLGAQSTNLRQQVRRLERRLAGAHDLRYTSPGTRAEFEAGLDALFALHRARWSHVTTNFGRREGFHRDFASLAYDRGWARLWLLELDGTPAAAWYGLRYAGSECYYQMGRDPQWDRGSVGFVLLVHSLREALADGITEYRFLRGGESFKYRFATDDPRLESLVAGRGAAAVAAAVQSALRLRRFVRRRLVRRSATGSAMRAPA